MNGRGKREKSVSNVHYKIHHDLASNRTRAACMEGPAHRRGEKYFVTNGIQHRYVFCPSAEEDQMTLRVYVVIGFLISNTVHSLLDKVSSPHPDQSP